MLKFNERLKQLRTSKDIIQKELAKFLEITPNAYQNYEYRLRKPNMETFVKLADYFDISLDYLVGRSDDPKRY